MIAAEVSDLRDSFSSEARSQRSKSSSSGLDRAYRTRCRSCGGLRPAEKSVCQRFVESRNGGKNESNTAHRRTRETCGPERLQQDLAAHGVKVGLYRIRRLRKKLGIRCKQKRKTGAGSTVLWNTGPW